MKALVAAPIFLIVLILDLITKAVAVSVLAPSGAPVAMAGDWFRFSLVYNPGAAFGLHLGPYSRWLFIALTAGALVVLWQLYRQALDADFRRVIAVALVAGGALGNAIDRVRSSAGVIDFVDIGVGAHRWPTFNIADIAVSSGAVLLALVLWHEEHKEARDTAPAGDSVVLSSTNAGDHPTAH